MPTPLLFDRTFKPSGLSATDSAVYYNGFKFPPAFKMQATIEPIYDDSERVLKYNKLNLRVECYLFHGLNLGTEGTVAIPDTTTNLYSGAYSREENTLNPPGANPVDGIRDMVTVDLEVDNLRYRLMEPGQQLVVYNQGLGTIKIQNGVGVPSIDGYMTDVANGPKPKLVTWRPLTNKMCYIVWEVETVYPPCNAVEYVEAGANVPDDLVGMAISGLAFSVTTSINEAGLTTRTISGKVEFPAWRETSLTTAHSGAAEWDANTNNIRTVLNAQFPLLQRFHRTLNFTVSEDRITVSFTVIDVEINSDEAYGPGCVREDVTLQVENQTDKVFSMWNVTLSGTIELAAGYGKGYAYDEITRLYNHFKTTKSIAGLRTSRGNDQPNDNAATEGSSSGETLVASRAILDRISLTDNIFGRSVSFSFRWTLWCDLPYLFQGTGLFQPTRTAANTNTAWNEWKTSLGIYLQDRLGYQDLGFFHNDDVVVSLCQNWTQGTPTSYTNPPDPDQGNDPEQPPETILPKDGWNQMEPNFEVISDEHSAFHAPLGDYSSSQETSRTPKAQRESTETTVVDTIPSSIDANQQTYIHNRRQPTYYIRFYGLARRLNYPVPEPHITSYGGRDVRRVGRTMLRPKFLGVGIDLDTNESHKMYGLIWEKTYALPLPPTTGTIKTDAHKDIV